MGPHMLVHLIVLFGEHVMEIWTYMKWISKFRDLDVHFESTGTGMRTRDKFRDLDVYFESTGTYLKSRDKFGDRR